MSVPQHMVALAKANQVRSAQRVIKREIASGEVSIAAALDDERAQSISIGDLLCAQRSWGDVRTRRLLRPLGIGELKRVRELTARQRQVLLDDLCLYSPTTGRAA